MREIQVAELRRIQIEILKELVRFCDDNQIRYFLCGATLLGAVRPKGFIPWDDDIDIMILRKDYQRLLELYKNNDIFTLFSGNITPTYPFPFAKLSKNNSILKEDTNIKFDMGVNIDIFPIDALPSNNKKLKLHILHIKLYRLLWLGKANLIFRNKKNPQKIPMKIILKLFSFFVSYGYLNKRIDKLAQSYDFEKSDFAGIAVWGYGINERCCKSIYENTIKLEFEGFQFDAPANYTEYLSNVYGNYMQLPPEEKRNTHHEFKAYLTSSLICNVLIYTLDSVLSV